MISRNYIKCNACEQPIMIRVQVGYEKYQAHIFACPGCEESLSITLDLTNPPFVGLDHDESCAVIDMVAECTVVNLATGFLIPKDKVSDEKYFPALNFFMQPKLRPFMMPNRGNQIVGGLFEGFPGAARAWTPMCRAARFNLKNDADRTIEHLAKLRKETGFPEASYEGYLFYFVGSFVGKAFREKFFDLLDWCVAIVDKSPEHIKEFYVEFSGLHKDRVTEYLSVLSDYFASYTDFEQTLVYARLGLECEADGQVSANDFNSTKMFYGNAFEVMGSHLDFFVALNNLDSGRGYNELSQCSLDKYRQFDKSGRMKALEGVAEISNVIVEYDNMIRNASHHRWFRLSGDRQSISYKKSASSMETILPYSEYSLRCNKMTMQLMLMYLCEVSVIKYIQQKIKANWF